MIKHRIRSQTSGAVGARLTDGAVERERERQRERERERERDRKEREPREGTHPPAILLFLNSCIWSHAYLWCLLLGC